jgi:glucosamine 6-phosphate synthetase-like amidotransferase/phosphosugar isomerase protein
MCGIVGYVGERETVPVLIDGLRRLEYRGYDSAGIAVIDTAGSVGIRRAAGKLANLVNELEAEPTASQLRTTPTRTETPPAASRSCTTASSRTSSSSVGA